MENSGRSARRRATGVTMHEWLALSGFALPDLGALAPAVHFAAGVVAVMLVQGVIVAWARWARRRAARRRAFRPGDPRAIWSELGRMRAECAASIANLEAAVARLKDTAQAHHAGRGSNVEPIERLQRALDEKAAIIRHLEQQKTELELLKEGHVLELRRQDEQLSSRAAALATAEQTIALLHGLIGRPELAPPPAPKRAAG